MHLKTSSFRNAFEIVLQLKFIGKDFSIGIYFKRFYSRNAMESVLP